MEAKRERIFSRGTEDCPFEHYRLQMVSPGGVFANVHWHPEAEILYLRSGCVEVLVGKQTVFLQPGQILFVHPGELHSVKNQTQPSRYDAFVYAPELLTLPDTHFFQKEIMQPLQTGHKRLPMLLEPGSPGYETVAGALDTVCMEDAGAPKYKRTVFSSLLQIYLALEDRLCPVSEEILGKNHEILKKCLSYMSVHLGEHLTLEEISRQAHLHPNYLCALFKEYTGQTVFQHLIRMRIDKAAELLREPGVSVAEVAAACGFESPGFFGKKFNAVMGCTPKAYSLRVARK